jgi:hypothetical protein
MSVWAPLGGPDHPGRPPPPPYHPLSLCFAYNFNNRLKLRVQFQTFAAGCILQTISAARLNFTKFQDAISTHFLREVKLSKKCIEKFYKITETFLNEQVSVLEKN